MELSNIIFETTTDCNLNCSYCYNHWKRDDTFVRLNSYHKAIKVLKHVFKNSNIKQITFTGGEPFLSERFKELVLFCRMHHKNVSVISNGNVGKYKDYQDLISLGVQLFQFPVHSYQKEIHDNLTCVRGSWDATMQSITEVSSLNCFVVPVVVLTKINYKDLDHTLLFLNSLGLNRVMLNRYNIGGKGIHGNHLPLNKTEIESAFKAASAIASKKGMVITANVCSPHCYINPSLFPNIAFGNCSTDTWRRPITLNIEGDVRLCNHSPVIAGNIFKNNLEQIINSDYSKSWALIKPEYCSTCTLYNKCQGGCRAASEQMGLTLSHPDPVIEIMNEPA